MTTSPSPPNRSANCTGRPTTSLSAAVTASRVVRFGAARPLSKSPTRPVDHDSPCDSIADAKFSRLTRAARLNACALEPTVDFSVMVDRDDVRVIQPRRGVRLAAEPLRKAGVLR